MPIFQYEKEATATSILGKMNTWLATPELASLVRSFGGDYDGNAPLAEQVKQLLDFSEAWDFRGRQKQDAKGAENARWTVGGGQLSAEQERLTMDAAGKLGLIGCTEPSQSQYDHILVLGGARMSCLYRMKYAREICTRHGAAAKSIIGLAGMRAVMESERAATDAYAPGAKTEFDLMDAAIRKTFGRLEIAGEQGEARKNSSASWALRRYANDIPVTLLAAPSGEPEKRRANTADTFAFLMERLDIGRGKSILLVTSQIYVPYQQLEAVRMLGIPYGHSLETVGFPNAWSGSMQGMRQPENYLQEIRSTLQAMGRLLS